MSITDLDAMMDAQAGGSPTYTGKLVSQQTALSVSAVWASIGAIADDWATLPLQTYRQLDAGRELAKDHYLWTLLYEDANPELTAWRFKQLMQTWVLLWGNAYAEMVLNGRGQIIALWPWRPDRVEIHRVNGQLEYTYTMADRSKVTVPHDRMFHLRGLGIDGIVGLSPIQMHKQTIGLSMAVTEHGARFFGNGARPLGMLTYPGKLGDKAYESLKESWEKKHQGLTNAHRLAILEEGMKYDEVGSKMVDAQYLETMQFTVDDIARIFKVPPHRIGSLARSTNNNIEQQAREYVDYCLLPWAANWQEQIMSSMLSTRERQTIFVKANFRGLLRGDMAAQSEFWGAWRDKGVVNGDEIRDEVLDMNAQPDGLGKKYWMPVNYQVQGESQQSPAPSQLPAMPPVKPNGKTNGAVTQ